MTKSQKNLFVYNKKMINYIECFDKTDLSKS